MVRRWHPARRTTPGVFRTPSRVAFLPRMRTASPVPFSKFVPPPLASIEGSVGVVVGLSATISSAHRVAAITGSVGVTVGVSGEAWFQHGPPVASDVVLEWDFDNDGDFDEPEEIITGKVMSLETFSGRDFPSQLTGTAGPGRFRATLNNEDDSFNAFRVDSPYTQPPFSLATGPKLRVRTATAASPDPVLLALDRFRRADSSSLGSADPGGAWTQPLADDFKIVSQHAVASSEGDPHLAYLDIGVADYYLQILIAGMGSLTNRAGIVYRYVDSNDYSLTLVDAAAQAVRVINVVSGAETTIASVPSEIYSGVTLGVLLADTTVTVYLDGVPLVVAAAINSGSDLAGIYAHWGTGDTAPVVDNVWAWDRLGTTEPGILWTGDVADIIPTVLPGPLKAASLTGEGWLGKMAAQDVSPPTSVAGRRTGRLLGAVLAECQLIHPPGPLDLGDVTTGPFAMAATTALRVSQDIEEAEFGFLYETPEGPIGYDSRTARDGSTAVVTFSDAPGAQFGYESIDQLDWKRQVFNRVNAGVSPYSLGVEQVLYTDAGPYVLAPGESVQLQATYGGNDGIVTRWTGHTRDVSAPAPPSGISVTGGFYTTLPSGDNELVMTLPTTAAGDLLLVMFQVFLAPAQVDTPSGWTLLGPVADTIYRGYIYGRIAQGNEAGQTFEIDFGGAQPWAAQMYRIQDWFGDLAGVEVTASVYAGGHPNPPAITPSWGAIPTLFLACAGRQFVSDNGGNVSSGPSGYTDLTFTEGGGNVPGNPAPWIATARRIVESTTENPGTFTANTATANSGSASWTIAVRGSTAPTPVSADTPAGTNAIFTVAYDNTIGGDFQSHTNIQVSGVLLERGDDVTVQAEDVVSQERHRAIRTYRTGASLFASPADALVYAERVLSRHAAGRPILVISFTATQSAAYRQQALRRRLSDRIHLVANHTSGLGIDADFFIESINHVVSQGTTLWRVIWELSPAPI